MEQLGQLEQLKLQVLELEQHQLVEQLVLELKQQHLDQQSRIQ